MCRNVQHSTNNIHDAYFATTGYHCILSTAIANSVGENNLLLINPSFQYRELISSLESTKGCPFQEIMILDRNSLMKELKRTGYIKNDTSVKLVKWFQKYYNMYRLKKKLEDLSINDAYVANHNRPAGQYLLEKSTGDQIYVEDGLAAYGPAKKINQSNLFKLITAKAVYGDFWIGRTPLGLDPRLTRIAASNPSYIHKDYQHLNCDQIELNDCHNFLKRWASKYFSNIKISAQIFELTSIVLLPHSVKYLNDNLLSNEIDNVINLLVDKGEKVGVKYHPRETNAFLEFKDQIDVIPKSIPAEFLYLNCENLSIVIGSASTTLLSARLFDVKAEVYTLNSINSNSNYHQLWKKIGVSSTGSIY